MSGATTTHIHDQPTGDLDALLTQGLLDHAERFAIRNLQPIVDRLVLQQLARRSAPRLEPASAAAILDQAIPQVTEELMTWAQRYSAMRWLWMLRRLPNRVFEGEYRTTKGYDTALAEVICSRSQASGPVLTPGVLVYPITFEIATHLGRLCHGIRYLSHLHSLFRWSGKGSAISFMSRSRPAATPDATLRTAVELYDRRMESYARHLSRMGTPVSQWDRSESESPLVAVARVSAYSPELPTDSDETSTVLADATYMTIPFSIDSLDRLLADPRIRLGQIVTPETAAVLCLLAAGVGLISGHSSGFVSTLRTGYLVYAASALDSKLASALSSLPEPLQVLAEAAGLASTERVIATLRAISADPWPLFPGRVIQTDGGAACLDLLSASERLDAAMQFPSVQGDLANARAEHFEIETQDVIGRSAWRPSEALRALRGRTLMSNGNAITDIDALGELGSDLLLVSCKSTIYTREYDRGQYQAVRAARSTVENAVSHWKDVIERLRQSRRGDNFDFSRYQEICGTVCTPTVVFTNAGESTRLVRPGLRAAVSIGELGEWVASPATPS
jgi:hypothetical protein